MSCPAKGVTVFVTTHYMDEAEYCDRIGLIYRGELIALGTPEAAQDRLMQDEVLEMLCERPQDAMDEIETYARASRRWPFSARGLHVVAGRSRGLQGIIRRSAWPTRVSA